MTVSNRQIKGPRYEVCNARYMPGHTVDTNGLIVSRDYGGFSASVTSRNVLCHTYQLHARRKTRCLKPAITCWCWRIGLGESKESKAPSGIMGILAGSGLSTRHPLPVGMQLAVQEEPQHIRRTA